MMSQPSDMDNDVYILPPSFAQERLWFLDQLLPDGSVYNMADAWRLKGPLNAGALERSLSEIVQRHEVLRTTFKMVDGQLGQVIAPTLTVGLPLIDLQALPEIQKVERVLRLAAEAACQPFDLAHGPLLRASLLSLQADEHVVVVSMHHIVSDAWSCGVFEHELMALYEAFSHCQPSPLPELPIQYADYACWQREWMEREVYQHQLAYWKKKLAGHLPMLHLLTDRSRPALATHRGDTLILMMPATLTEQLQSFSRREGATLFMTLLAAFKVLLHHLTKQKDILVGTPIANRNRAELENLIGFFVNTLVLRTDLSGEPTFREIVRRVRDVALGAYDHQDLPFEKLVEELKPERNTSYNPIFQVMFVVTNASQSTFQLPGLATSRLTFPDYTAKFDLTLYLSEHADGLKATVEFNTDLFNPDTIQRLLERLQLLLETVVAKPDARLSQFALLTETERQWLAARNPTSCVWPQEKCIHQWFEACAAETPDAIAVVCEKQALTYRALNRQANQLAHHLRALGVGPETLVAVFMDRSLEMVMSILGILKAGGAYLPLDPVYPPERLAFMLEDAKAPVLLTQQRLAAALPAHQAKVICLDVESKSLARENEQNPTSGVHPDHLAYVIYTSGSTGKPKGTQVTHYNVVRLMQATDAWFHFNADDVWTFFHSHAFDFSVWEIWGALFYGGKLIVVPYAVSRSPEAFLELLSQERVTVLNQTPSAFRQLMNAEQNASTVTPLALRYVIFGGEALELQSLKPWFDRHSDHHPQLVNMYGITETTVHVTYRPITKADLSAGSVIGVPIPDLQVYLLDAHRQPVPIGVTGEIYVGGAGVGRGYLKRPELTAEKFLDDIITGKPGARLYRSGDLARWLPNGDLEYLGRIDHQVKIRGYRIELGEIESVLATHPAVRETLVMAREDAPGEKRLVAYFVAKSQPLPSVSELRQFMKAKLPDYMIPAVFVTLDAMPLTQNGKVDRRALPVPDLARPDLAATHVAPRTPIEQALVDIWGAVLKVERVGVNDNFFELGGHSLLATQVIARIRAALQRDVPLRLLFETPTVAGLAESVTHLEQEFSESRIRQIPMAMTGASANVDTLTDAEVDAMLAAMLSGKAES